MSGVEGLSGCSNPERKLDVVFVHGIDSDEKSAWSSNGSPEAYWPKWIADEFPSLGFWTIGYAANVSGWTGESMAIADRGNAILDEMESDGFGDRPIIFIAHSLGGIMVKQLLRGAVTLHVSRWEKIATNTLGIIFIATPHAGSGLANFASFIDMVLRTTETAEELKRHDSRLRELHGWFLGFCKKQRLLCRAFGESREVREVLGRKLPKGLMVVDQTSAEPNIPGERAVFLDENHISISKPKSRQAPLYKGVKRFLYECLAAVEARAESRTVSSTANAASTPDQNIESVSEFAEISRLLREYEMLLGRVFELFTELGFKVAEETQNDAAGTELQRVISEMGMKIHAKGARLLIRPEIATEIGKDLRNAIETAYVALAKLTTPNGGPIQPLAVAIGKLAETRRQYFRAMQA
jgi:hypothetical protein